MNTRGLRRLSALVVVLVLSMVLPMQGLAASVEGFTGEYISSVNLAVDAGYAWHLMTDDEATAYELTSYTDSNVYIAGNSGKTMTSATVSNLAITVAEPGELFFEFGTSMYANSANNYLGYRIGSAITTDDDENSITCIAQGEYRPTTDTWETYSISIDESAFGDESTVTVYIAFESFGYYEKYGDYLNYAAIRNVVYSTGERNDVVQGYDTAMGTVTAQLVTPTTNDEGTTSETLTDAELSELAIGSAYRLTATANDGYQFYGWVKHSGEAAEYQTLSSGKLDVTVDQSAYYTPIFAAEGTYVLRNGTTFYDGTASLKTVIEGAASGDVLVLLENATVSEDITVPTGVTLYLPFRDVWEYEEAEGHYHSQTDSKVSRSKAIAGEDKTYVRLSVESEKTLTVNGEVVIGSVVGYRRQRYQNHVSGYHGRITNNGTIEINDGGSLKCYGIVDGSGTVYANDGATVKESFIVGDYSGGNNSADLFEAHQMPFKRYAMQSVQCLLQMESGADLVAMMNLYALSTFNEAEVILMGNSEEATFKTVDGQSDTLVLERTYDSTKALTDGNGVKDVTGLGRTEWTFSNGLTFQPLTISMGGLALDTSNCDFVVPYNFKLNLVDGNYYIPRGLRLLPGAQMYIAKDANVTVNGQLMVMDGLIQSDIHNESGNLYPTREILSAAGFSGCGELIVDGTLIMRKGSSLGGLIKSNGGGTVVIEDDVYVNNSGTLSKLDQAVELYNQSYEFVISEGGVYDTEKEKIYNWVQQDGAQGYYDENTTWYNLPARIYTADGIVKAEAGKIYTSTACTETTVSYTVDYLYVADGVYGKVSDDTYGYLTDSGSREMTAASEEVSYNVSAVWTEGYDTSDLSFINGAQTMSYDDALAEAQGTDSVSLTAPDGCYFVGWFSDLSIEAPDGYYVIDPSNTTALAGNEFRPVYDKTGKGTYNALWIKGGGSYVVNVNESHSAVTVITGDSDYAALSTAITDANGAARIKLVKDMTLSSAVSTTVAVNLDMNGCKILSYGFDVTTTGNTIESSRAGGAFGDASNQATYLTGSGRFDQIRDIDFVGSTSAAAITVSNGSTIQNCTFTGYIQLEGSGTTCIDSCAIDSSSYVLLQNNSEGVTIVTNSKMNTASSTAPFYGCTEIGGTIQLGAGNKVTATSADSLFSNLGTAEFTSTKSTYQIKAGGSIASNCTAVTYPESVSAELDSNGYVVFDEPWVITYMADGILVDTKVVADGQKADLTVEYTYGDNRNWQLVGWTNDKDGTEPLVEFTPTEDTTLYAIKIQMGIMFGSKTQEYVSGNVTGSGNNKDAAWYIYNANRLGELDSLTLGADNGNKARLVFTAEALDEIASQIDGNSKNMSVLLYWSTDDVSEGASSRVKIVLTYEGYALDIPEGVQVRMYPQQTNKYKKFVVYNVDTPDTLIDSATEVGKYTYFNLTEFGIYELKALDGAYLSESQTTGSVSITLEGTDAALTVEDATKLAGMSSLGVSGGGIALTFSEEALDSIASQAGSGSVTISKVNTYNPADGVAARAEMSVTDENGDPVNFTGDVNVLIVFPYTEGKTYLTYYVPDEGAPVGIDFEINDHSTDYKKASFTVSHFSTYEIIECQAYVDWADGRENTYYTLAGAVKAATNEGDKVVLTQSVAVTEPIQIASGQNVTIDLNGNTITYSSTVFKNYGTLALNFSGGSMVSSDAYACVSAIQNYGTLNLDLGGGALKWTAPEASKINNSFAPLYNHAGATANVELNGGTIDLEIVYTDNTATVNQTTYRTAAVYNAGTVAITDSAKTGVIQANVQAHKDDIANDTGTAVYATAAIYNIGEMTVSDTTVTNYQPTEKQASAALVNGAGGSLELKNVTLVNSMHYGLINIGGTISSISDCEMTSVYYGLTNYNTAIKNEDGTYSVGDQGRIESITDTTITPASSYAIVNRGYIGTIGGECTINGDMTLKNESVISNIGGDGSAVTVTGEISMDNATIDKIGVINDTITLQVIALKNGSRINSIGGDGGTVSITGSAPIYMPEVTDSNAASSIGVIGAANSEVNITSTYKYAIRINAGGNWIETIGASGSTVTLKAMSATRADTVYIYPDSWIDTVGGDGSTVIISGIRPILMNGKINYLGCGENSRVELLATGTGIWMNNAAAEIGEMGNGLIVYNDRTATATDYLRNYAVYPYKGTIKLISGGYYYSAAGGRDMAVYEPDNRTYADGCTLSADTVAVKLSNETDVNCYYVKLVHEHAYPENATFTWTENEAGGYDVTATLTCTAENCPDEPFTGTAVVTPVTTEATCTEDGKIVYTATVTLNGNEYTDTKTDTIAAAGHTMGEWEEVKVATCDEVGEERCYCSACDYYESRTTTCGHTREYDWDVDGDGVLEILAIGNSFSTDALQYAWQIANDLGIENVVLGNLYIGGCTLETHATNAANDAAAYTYYYNDSGSWNSTSNYKISTALTERSWDYVTLQQQSGESGLEDTYNENLTNLIAYVQEQVSSKDNSNCNPCTKLAWHMTWAYQQDSTHKAFPDYNSDQMTMYNAIASAVKSKIVTNDAFDYVIPSGTAVQNARTSLIGDALTRDGYHMSKPYGRYLTGLMYIKTLTGLDVDGIEYSPDGVNAMYQQIAIESVNNAALTPYEVTQSVYGGYMEQEFALTRCAYWKSNSSRYNALHSGSDTADKFYATHRFTRETLPVGSIIVVEDGWEYRPEGWVTDTKQSSRPATTGETIVHVTEEWWGDYTIRAFNITNGSSVEDVTAEEIYNVFRIYVPEGTPVHYYESVVTEPTWTNDGYTTYTCICGNTYTDSYVDALVAVAQVGETKYETLAEAVEAAESGATVTLLADATGAGVVIDKSITIDFNGHTYTFNKAVGSTGTATLGFQILAGNDVALKNGTLTSTAVTEGKEVKVLIQNYANLTLTDMNLVDNTEHILYCLSNNSGNIVVNGETNITTDAVAFDVYDFSSGGYTVPSMSVNTTGTIEGKIEVSETATLAISGGTFTVEIKEKWCAEGYGPSDNGDGTYGVHQHSYESVVTAPTCTAGGYTTYTCSVCGDTYTANEVAATGHTEATREENRVEATCGKDGSYDLVTYCSVCSTVIKTEAQTITATGNHSYTWETTTAATCVATGVETGTCSCGATTTREIAVDSDAHNLVTVEAKAATCTEKGWEAYEYCDREGCGHTTYVEIPMTDHSYSDEYLFDATGHWHECSCGAKSDEAGHDWDDGEVTKEATSTEAGEMTYTCGTCSATKTEEIPATGYRVKVATYSVSLDAEVVMNYYVVIPDELAVDDDAYATMTLAGTELGEKIPMSEIRETYDSTKQRYKIEFGVASIFMTKNVELRIYDGEGNVVTLYTNTYEGDVYARSIQYYIETRLGKQIDDAEKELLVAIATYGGYAQKYFREVKGNTAIDENYLYDILSNYGLERADISGITNETVNRVNDRGDNESNMNFTLKTFTIALDSAVKLTLKFEMGEGYDIDDFTYVLTYTEDGEEKTMPMVATKDSSTGRCVLVIEDIASIYWDYEYKITVTNNETNESNTWGTSVLAFVTTKLKSSTAADAEKDVVRAMYLYNAAADKKLGN